MKKYYVTPNVKIVRVQPFLLFTPSKENFQYLGNSSSREADMRFSDYDDEE